MRSSFSWWISEVLIKDLEASCHNVMHGNLSKKPSLPTLRREGLPRSEKWRHFMADISKIVHGRRCSGALANGVAAYLPGLMNTWWHYFQEAAISEGYPELTCTTSKRKGLWFFHVANSARMLKSTKIHVDWIRVIQVMTSFRVWLFSRKGYWKIHSIQLQSVRHYSFQVLGASVGRPFSSIYQYITLTSPTYTVVHESR